MTGSGDGAAGDELVTVDVDGEVCVGIGQCELLEPEMFRVDDDGLAVIIGSGRLPVERAAAVVEACPSGAIRIRTGEG